MTDARTEARWDHERDHRKNYIPEPPLHVQTAPLSTAMDIVVLVKRMDNYEACAALIESHTRSAVQAALLDKKVST